MEDLGSTVDLELELALHHGGALAVELTYNLAMALLRLGGDHNIFGSFSGPLTRPHARVWIRTAAQLAEAASLFAPTHIGLASVGAFSRMSLLGGAHEQEQHCHATSVNTGGGNVLSAADRCPAMAAGLHIDTTSVGVEDAVDAEWAAKGLQRLSRIALPCDGRKPPPTPEGSWAPRITTELVLQDGQLSPPNYVTLLKLFKGT